MPAEVGAIRRPNPGDAAEFTIPATLRAGRPAAPQVAQAVADTPGMDGILVPIAIGILALLLVAMIVAWWENRKRMAQIQRQLDRSERARAELQQSAQEMRARLSAVDQQRPSQPPSKRGPAVKPATANAGSAREATPASSGAVPSAAREGHDATRATEKPTPAHPANAVAALAAASATSATAPAEPRLVGWSDTEVMGGHTVPSAFAETLPAELGYHGSAHQYAATMPAELDAQSRPMPFAQGPQVKLAFELDPPASRNPRPPGQTG